MALLILIAAIMIGMSYLYLSADMMTPQFASTPETDRVIRKDSLRQYGGNYLRHSESGKSADLPTKEAKPSAN